MIYEPIYFSKEGFVEILTYDETVIRGGKGDNLLFKLYQQSYKPIKLKFEGEGIVVENKYVVELI